MRNARAYKHYTYNVGTVAAHENYGTLWQKLQGTQPSTSVVQSRTVAVTLNLCERPEHERAAR